MKRIVLTFVVLILAGGITNAVAATLTVGNVPKVNTGGTTPKLEDSAISQSGSNVGIGSTTPRTTLDVNGTVTAAAFSGTGSGASYTQGNLGVGTTIPGVALYVNGTTTTTGFKLPGNGAAASYVLTSNSVGVGTWMPSTGSGSGTVNTGAVGAITYYPSAGTTVDDSAIMFTDGTNVGVGTTGPSALLDVNRKLMVFAGGNVGIGSVTPGQVLDVNGAIRSIASGNSTIGGNLGIGTTTPPQALYVVGTIEATVGFKAANNVGISTTKANPTNVQITNGIITTWN